MLDLMQLRETVDLPSGYSEAMPEAERKVLLRGSLAEYRLRNKVLGLEKPDKPKKKIGFSGSGRSYSRSTYNTKTARIARYLSTIKRANGREIEAATGIALPSILPALVFMRNDKLVKDNGRKKFNGGRYGKAYSITPAGVGYGLKP